MEASINDIVTHRPGSGTHASVKHRPPTTRVDQAARPAGERALPQLGLRGIVGVWAAAALPMALFAWVVAPALADQLSGSSGLARALFITLTVGLVWQFALVLTSSRESRERCGGRCYATRSGSAPRVLRAPGVAEASCGSSLCR